MSIDSSSVIFYVVAATCVIIIFFVILFLIVNKHDINGLKKKVRSANDNLFPKGSPDVSALPVPSVLCDENGKVIWYNTIFYDTLLKDYEISRRKLNSIFSELVQTGSEENFKFANKTLKVFSSRMENDDKVAYIFFLIDISYYTELEIKYDESRPVVIMVSIDGLDVAAAKFTNATYRALYNETENMITDWFTEKSCFFRQTSDDKFVALTEDINLRAMIECRFDILEKVRNHKIDEKSSGLSLSVGIGTGGDFIYCENESKKALEMALGRGGDQVAIKNGDSFQFFGGVSAGSEKSNQVQTRIIAKSIEDAIIDSANVLIMGHKNSDLDSVGSSIGMAAAVRNLNVPVNIVVDEKTSLARNLIYHYNDAVDDNLFISPYVAKQMITPQTLLIICDVMRAMILEDAEIYNTVNNIIVIDHHRMSVDRITNATISYHEPKASSACEMVTELIRYFPSKPTLKQVEAEALLSGIYLDTRNFTLRTGVRTFEAAAYLRDCRADTIAVRKLFSSSIDEYELIHTIVVGAHYMGNFAIAMSEERNDNIQLIAAKAADELLNVNGVDASFVLFPLNENDISISARSYGRVNVQIIMENLGGGGHQTMAATQLRNSTITEAREKLLKLLSLEL